MENRKRTEVVENIEYWRMKIMTMRTNLTKMSGKIEETAGSVAHGEEEYVIDNDKEHGQNQSDQDYPSSADGDDQDDPEDYSYST